MFDDSFRARYGSIPFATYLFETGRSGAAMLHWHREVEIISVLTGRVDFFVDGQRHTLNGGEVLIIGPCALHRTELYADIYTSYICICFDCSLLCDRTLSDGLEQDTLTVLPHVAGSETAVACSDFVFGAYDASQKGEGGWELAAVGYLSLLFSRLFADGYIVPKVRHAGDRDFCRRVLAYIKEHYCEDITSRHAAEALYLDNSYFCRLFRARFGICFSHYLCGYRIERAKELLRDADLSVSSVAEAVGFHNFSYFSKMFRQNCGVSPSCFRGK